MGCLVSIHLANIVSLNKLLMLLVRRLRNDHFAVTVPINIANH